MRNLVLFMHVSLDGFVAGPGGEMDWINVNEELFDFVAARINAGNTALYGRVTWEMMESYWPTAADQPSPTKHDIEHSKWYSQVHKVVLSRSLKGRNFPNTTVLSEDIPQQVSAIKQQPGNEIIIFGSPGAAHALMHHNLIDEYWLFVNPVLLGTGIPLFADINERIPLKLVSNHAFPSGVICLHYIKQ
jgi:dihydrofolate reductase